MKTRFLAAALILASAASLASGASIVTQYQWNPTGDWFAEPPVTPTGTSAVSLGNYSNQQTNSGIFNYISNTLITNGILNDASTPISGISGPGLSFIAQNSGEAFGTFRLRPNLGRFNVEAGAGSGGLTMLAWSSAAATPLAGLTFALSIGPAGTNPANYLEGLRVAIQDTSDNWYLSSWTSNGADPDPGTTPGLFTVDLGTATWAAYSAADLNSSALGSFDAGAATFSTFGGDVQAFGFFSQQGAGGTAYRINGFQVTVPEPGSALLFGLGTVVLALRRRRA